MKPKSNKTKSNSVGLSQTTPQGPQIIDGFLHFSAIDLTRYENAQLKVLNSIQAIGLKKAEVEAAKRVFEDQARKLNYEMQLLVDGARQAESDLIRVQTDLQGSYGLDFKQVSYDDVTGRIMVLGNPVSEEDLKKPTEPLKE